MCIVYADWSTSPGLREFGKGDRMLRHKVPKSLVPDAKGGQTKIAKGNYIPYRKLAAQASEVAQHGAINAGEEGADRVFKAAARQGALKEALQGDVKQERETAEQILSFTSRKQGDTEEERKAAEQIFSATSRKTTSGDVIIAVAVVSLVAAGCYALYRWVSKKKSEKKD